MDGEGTLITTKECLLNRNRNPHLSQNEIETYLTNYLGAEKIIWLEQGLYNDETNGHVDNILSFVRPGEVVLAYTEDQSSPHYERCQSALKRLQEETDAKGRKLLVHLMPIPDSIYLSEEESRNMMVNDITRSAEPGEPLPASYVNFLIVNGAVIMPVFNDKKDAEAISLMKIIFKARQIVPIYSKEIILGGGNIHCITQQKPKAVKSC